ncbi:hypothetical protein EKN38_22275 [Enterobacter sp. WCHEn045836]|uniref:hypothetical protein n=1 Tax=Enterobacter sp. WCHEn045836 TaxID=2497434 RepID=UPI000F83C023|nr:hypothetical protein [Enterobacter sp. WCHEn045836]RTP97273.1 hypothetical protein EKN38_22275 [Enterobacter sp. WCHEn045836]
MDTNYKLCEKILLLCLQKKGNEDMKGYVSSIHPVLLSDSKDQQEILNHFQWLEEKNLVRPFRHSLAASGVPRVIITLTNAGYIKIMKGGIKSALGSNLNSY